MAFYSVETSLPEPGLSDNIFETRKNALISSLPEEVVFKIFSFNPDLPQSRTCRKWRNIALETYFVSKTETVVKNILETKTTNFFKTENHLENLQVLVSHLAKLGCKEPVNSKSEELSPLAYRCFSLILKRIKPLPLSKQNDIIDQVIVAWKTQSTHLLPLVKALYLNKYTSQAMRLHIINNENTGSFIHKVLVENASKKEKSHEKLIIQIQTKEVTLKNSPKANSIHYLFESKRPSPSVLKNMCINPYHKFDKNELVVIEHKGELINNSTCPWYAVVQDINTGANGKNVYTVYRKSLSLKGKIHKTDILQLPPEKLGKISRSPKLIESLPKSYLSSI